MATLADIRQQHPEYNDLPDGVLADKLYQKFYSDIPRAQFDAKVGLKASPPAPPQAAPNSAVDMARSVPGGLAKGVAAIAGLPGDLVSMARAGVKALPDLSLPPAMQAAKDAHPFQPMGSLPGSSDISTAIGKAAGGYYQPQTTLGKYAETIASFAPAAVAPGGIAARIARVAVPGAASEAAGEATQGTPLEPYARAGGALLGAGAIPAARALGRGIAGVANRVSEAAFDTPLRDPTEAARGAIRRSIVSDGGAAPVTDRLNAWAASGASNPSLIDVSGNNVRRLVRASAGAEGDAQNVAQSYADRIAGNLQDRASARARELTPGDTRTAQAAQTEIEAARRTDANTNYAQPYAQPAQVTPEMVSALQGPEGRGAISQAYVTARAQRDEQAMAELQDLQGVASEQGGGRDPITGRIRSVADALGTLSAGSLDRVRIAMRETGRSLAARGRTGMAAGYGSRTRDIDTALDQTPGLQDARASYRNFSAQSDAVDAGNAAMRTPSGDYAATIADLARQSPQGARPAAGVGYRDAIVAGIERPAEGSTGFLNTLATSNRNTANLTETFGAPAATRFQAGIGNEADRLRNARMISPNTGSQTEGRLADRALVDGLTGNHVGFVRGAIEKILTGSTTLTPREKAELVRLGTTEADLRGLMQSLPTRDPGQIATALISGQIGHASGQR